VILFGMVKNGPIIMTKTRFINLTAQNTLTKWTTVCVIPLECVIHMIIIVLAGYMLRVDGLITHVDSVTKLSTQLEPPSNVPKH
jgi:hypothetical protein